MAKHIKIGEIGENIAWGYLKDNGYKLVDRNYREKYGEIDIIAINTNKILTFIEVKTLRNLSFSDVDNSAVMGITPEDNATFRKLEKVRKVAEMYANKNPKLIYKDRGWQVDLIAINMADEKHYKMRHYKNI